MKNWLKIMVVILVIVVYIFSINLFASLINSSSKGQSISNFISGDFNIQIGISNSVGIIVTRNRWYGKIIIINGIEHLYLLNLIKLPKRIKSYNFIIFHLIFLTIIILFTILIFTKNKVYKEEIPNLEYESLAKNPLDNS